ncbi:hypothetical protein [Legionella brunensis]|uniref:Uncharacterized protein n=1 Tax=Legionella brunensis TaxID=29422 RepID=A0A0W0SSF7_9GAMM|nr:hypothetical protein [Legionella brunensis]KTC86326.1 hypothetical protein Lbru_0820 [Legionella brunensis]
MKSKQFITIFYQKLLAILNNQKQLQDTQIYFQQEDRNNERYFCRATFGLYGWNPEDASKFSAAVAEALRETTLLFFTTDDAKLRLIQDCSETIKTKLIPQLTLNLNHQNPFEELKQKIEKELKQLSQEELSFKNPYVLFASVSAVAVVATAVAWNLAQPNP